MISSKKSAQILDGKNLASIYESKLKIEVEKLGATPRLCVILAGNNPSSLSYVNMKKRACERVNIESDIIHFKENVSQDKILREIERLNADSSVHGILVQLPLPSHINTNLILEAIDTNKDVDGFHPYNVGKLCENIDTFVPATPLGIMLMLEHYKIKVSGKNVVIIGASNIVGKPLARLMLNAGATITLCHILTENLAFHTKNADIVCVAVGKINLLRADMIKKGAIVIDIGINRNEAGKITGDVDFESVAKKASFITPVPGGVGPMTISALLKNTIRATKIQEKIQRNKRENNIKKATK